MIQYRFTLITVAILLGMVAGCDSNPAGIGRRWSPPLFTLQPGTTPSDTDCTRGVAWVFNGAGGEGAHFIITDSAGIPRSRAAFYTPGSSLRTRCGALPFDESGSDTGYLRVTYIFTHGLQWQAWGRRLRSADDGSDAETYVKILAPDSNNSNRDSLDLKAPARVAHDLVGFGHHRADDSVGAIQLTAEVNAKAQVWRSINRPTSLEISSVSNLVARLHWSNQHLNREVDSTEVWRTSGSQWERLKELGHAVDSLRDTLVASGHYWYALRHVTKFFLYPDGDDDAGYLAQPNSGFTDSGLVTVGLFPPNGLVCEGNFAATMDCRWLDSVPASGASFQIWRDSTPTSLIATVAETTHTRTDTVTRGHQYRYKARRVKGSDSSAFGPTYTSVANPLAPEALSCGGTTSQTVVCVWVDKETASGTTARVERCQAASLSSCEGEWEEIGYAATAVNSYTDQNSGLKNNLTYWYQVRYLNGSEYTGYSNSDDAHPGSQEPYGPGGP